MINKVNAIKSLRANAVFTLRGDDLEWLDQNQTKPTAAEIDAEVARLQVLEPLKADIEQAKKYLAESDWVVVKIAELNLTGLDVSDQYLDILSHRKLMREVINAKETEIANV
jgi:hypothetical protein